MASARGNPTFYPRLALRDEPSTTRKNWLTLLANYTYNIFGQHIAILRDVRLAFLGSRGAYFGGSKAEEREIHNSNTLTNFCPQEAYRKTGICGTSQAEAFRAEAEGSQMPFIFE